MAVDPVRTSDGVGPLAGVNVLDLTRFWNGPSATRVLADYGATVIKVEALNGGDEGRAMGQLKDGYNYFKEYTNRGKLSLSLDLKNPASKPVMKKLVEWANVVTENFKPGTLDSFGYGYDQMKEWNPKIVYCTNSGFGDRGPLAKQSSMDMVAQGFTGVMHNQGGGPSHAPFKADFAFSDELGATSFVQGILMALWSSMNTGKSERMDTSQTAASLQFQQAAMAAALHRNGDQPDRGPDKKVGNGQGGNGAAKWTANTYQASDGKWLVLMPKNFLKLLSVLGLPELAKDERVVRPRIRTKNQDWLEDEIQKVIKTNTREYWLKFIEEKGAGPSGPVNSYKDVMEHDQFWANGYLEKVHHNVPGAKKDGEVVLGKAFRFSETPAGPVGAGPEVGQHNGEVLKNILKLPQAEIDNLEKQKVISKL